MKQKKMNMEKTTTMLKTGLVGLFLTMTTTGVYAQLTPPEPLSALGPQSATLAGTTDRRNLFDPAIANFDDELINSILFFNPDQTNSFTLRASAIEDHEDDRGLSFTHYEWSYGTNGTDFTAIGSGAATLPQSGIGPGYHYYRVEARIVPVGTDPDLSCEADNIETFVVFVLPPLSVTATNTGGLSQYCESDAGTQSNVALSAAVAYDGYTGNPTVGEFDVNYRWYYVKSNGSEPFSQNHDDFVEVTKANITNATLIDGETSATYAPNISDVGTYKFFVEVEYQIKDRSHGLGTDDPTDRNRPYVIYRGWVGGPDQANATIVTVTPEPGKPHITIEEVLD